MSRPRDALPEDGGCTCPVPGDAGPPESDAIFRLTFEQAPLAMLHIGLDGRILRPNRKMCETSGYEADELVGRLAIELAVDQGASSVDQRQALQEGRIASYSAARRFRRKTGETYPARVSVTLVRDTATPYFISILEDLSQHEADQRRIQRQAEMLDQASDAIVVHGLEHRVRYWNKGAQRLFGWRADQAAGRTFSDLVGEASVLSADADATLFRDGHCTVQVPCRAADGSILQIERRLTLVRSEQGENIAVLSVNTDVTARVQAEHEVRRLNDDLEVRIRERTAELEQTNAELRRFAYSLAHDLRAPLGSLDGYASHLERHLAGRLDDTAQHYLRRVRASARLMSDLTDGLLCLTHLSQAEMVPQRVNLSGIARAWHDRVGRSEPHRRVSVRIADTPPVLGDLNLLCDLVEELLDNAWKFTRERAEGCIEFGTEEAHGMPLQFVVRDNGAGFDATYAHKLFVPFQRLHSAHEFPGNGVGLAIVRKIAQRHGGETWAESLPAGGAVFRFSLPGAGDAGQAA